MLLRVRNHLQLGILWGLQFKVYSHLKSEKRNLNSFNVNVTVSIPINCCWTFFLSFSWQQSFVQGQCCAAYMESNALNFALITSNGNCEWTWKNCENMKCALFKKVLWFAFWVLGAMQENSKMKANNKIA